MTSNEKSKYNIVLPNILIISNLYGQFKNRCLLIK